MKDCSLLDSRAGKYFGDCIDLAKYCLFSENNLKPTRLSLVAKGRFVCDMLKILSYEQECNSGEQESKELQCSPEIYVY